MPPYSHAVLNRMNALMRKRSGKKGKKSTAAARRRAMLNPFVLSTLARSAPKRKGRSTRRAPSMRKTVAPIGTGAVARPGARGPAGVGYKMEAISSIVTRVTGRAYLGAVNTSGKTTATAQNTIGLMFDINPVLLNDRVAVVASTFDKYVYQSVRFTYVPQCPTTTAGSVALVFERDPEQDAANPQSTQFLSEVMSYENPVLTPAWQECSTGYRRDPKELKTWFIGGSGGTISPRDTSQGHLITYLSNASNANTGYGFVVMDYVLDLVSPNIMPNLTGSLSRNLFVSQYIDDNGTSTSVQFNALASNAGLYTTAVPWVIACPTFTVNPLFQPGSTFFGLFKAIGAGAVGELVINGQDNTGTALVPSGDQLIVPATTTTAISIRTGSRIYWAVHSVNWITPTGTNSQSNVVTFHQTLQGAIASANTITSRAETAGVNTAFVFESGDVLAIQSNSQGYRVGTSTTTAQIALGGWVRLLQPGTVTAAQSTA